MEWILDFESGNLRLHTQANLGSSCLLYDL